VSLKGGDYVVRFTYNNRGVLKGEMVSLLETMELSVDSILENSLGIAAFSTCCTGRRRLW
jgi:hypothetical protein